MTETEVLTRLSELITQRRNLPDPASYTSALFERGQDQILKKLGEEVVEVVMASKDGRSEDVISEIADLWFHSLVVMAYHDIKISDISAELERREGISGLEEKANRTKS